MVRFSSTVPIGTFGRTGPLNRSSQRTVFLRSRNGDGRAYTDRDRAAAQSGLCNVPRSRSGLIRNAGHVTGESRNRSRLHNLSAEPTRLAVDIRVQLCSYQVSSKGEGALRGLFISSSYRSCDPWVGPELKSVACMIPFWLAAFQYKKSCDDAVTSG